jgi:hypothetical protein
MERDCLWAINIYINKISPEKDVFKAQRPVLLIRFCTFPCVGFEIKKSGDHFKGKGCSCSFVMTASFYIQIIF